MAKDKRPKPVQTNRTALEEYLSAETDTEVIDQDAPGLTGEPELEPDYFFRDKKLATGGPKGVERKTEDNGKRFKLPAEKDTFEDVIQPRTEQPSTTRVAPFPKEKFQRDEPDFVQDEEDVLLEQLMETSTALQEQLPNVDKKNKNQVAEFNKVVDLYNNTMSRLKEVNPVWNQKPDMIAHYYRNRDLIHNLTSGKPEQTISKFDPSRLVSVPGMPFDVQAGMLKEETLDDKQQAYNYQLLVKSLNRNLPITEAEKQSDVRGTPLGRLGGSFAQGVLSIPEGFVGMGQMLADETGIQPLQIMFDKQGEQLRSTIEGVAPVDPNYAEQLSSGLGSMISFMVPGVAAASFGNLAKVTPNVAKWLGIGTSAILESVTEAGLVYRESGNTEAATKTFLANLLMVSITNRYGLFADEMKPLKRTLMSTGLEGLQEGLQEVISQASQGREVNWKQVIESFGIGAIIGGGTAAAQRSAEEKKEPETFEDVLTPKTKQPSPTEPGSVIAARPGIQKIADVLNSEGMAKLQTEGVDFNPDLGRGKIYVRDTTVKDDKGAAAVYSIPVDQFTPEAVNQIIELGRKKFEKATEPVEATEKIEQTAAPDEKIEPEAVEAAEIPAEDKGVGKQTSKIKSTGLFKAAAVKTLEGKIFEGKIHPEAMEKMIEDELTKAKYDKLNEKQISELIDKKYDEVQTGFIDQKGNFLTQDESRELLNKTEIGNDAEIMSMDASSLGHAGILTSLTKAEPDRVADIKKKVEDQGLIFEGEKITTRKVKGKDVETVTVSTPDKKTTKELFVDKLDEELKKFDEAKGKKPEIKPKKVVEIERITDAAFRTPEGKILKGTSHPTIENVENVVENSEYGFYTSKGRFVNREEAAVIAKKAKQIPGNAPESIDAYAFSPYGIAEPKKITIKTADDLQKASTIDVRNFVKNEIGNEAFTKLMEDAVANDDSPVIEGKTQADMDGYAIDAAVHAKAMELVEGGLEVQSSKLEEQYKKIDAEHDKVIKQYNSGKIDKATFTVKAGKFVEQKHDIEKQLYPVKLIIEESRNIMGSSTGVIKGNINFKKGVPSEAMKMFFSVENGRYTPNETSKKYGIKNTENSYNLAFNPTKENVDAIKKVMEDQGYKVEIEDRNEPVPVESNKVAVERMLKEGKKPEDIAKSLGIPLSEVKSDLTVPEAIKDTVRMIAEMKSGFKDFAMKFQGEAKLKVASDLGLKFGDVDKEISIWDKINKIHSDWEAGKYSKTEAVEKIKAIEKVKPSAEQRLKEKIYDNLQYVNDKKMSGKARLKARNELKLQVNDLVKSGVAAQLKNESGKWNLYIDNVKQDKRSLGLVEKAEKVDISKVEYKEEVSKPFKQILMEIRDRQEIIAENFVEPEDLPSGSGQVVLDKGLKDIKENDGKEVTPEAMAVRQAAEFIFKNGKSVIRMKHFPKQDILPEEIWLFVDERIEEKAVQELNSMEEASEEERISAEAVIEKADDLEKRIDEADTAEEIEALADEVDEVAGDLFGEAKKLGHKKKSIFAEQTSFADLAKAKVPDKGITGEGKGEETTPLFQQKQEAKGQEKMFEGEEITPVQTFLKGKELIGTANINKAGNLVGEFRRFGATEFGDQSRGGTWYEIPAYEGAKSSYQAGWWGSRETKFGVGGQTEFKKNIELKNPYFFDWTGLGEGKSPIKLAEKVLGKEETNKLKKGITGVKEPEKAYARLENAISQELQKQGFDGVVLYDKTGDMIHPKQAFVFTAKEKKKFAEPVEKIESQPLDEETFYKEQDKKLKAIQVQLRDVVSEYRKQENINFRTTDEQIQLSLEKGVSGKLSEDYVALLKQATKINYDYGKYLSGLKSEQAENIGYGTAEDEELTPETIEDFGDKIGGARKDTAESGYEMTGGKKKDETPAWMKGFRTGLKEDGTFQPFFATERGFIQWRSRDVYATEEEAITAIKLFNVTQRFRVSGNDQGYEIYRKVTNKKLVSIKKGFKTRDEAYKYIVDHADEFLEYKPQFPERPHIEDLQRTGKEYRKGDVTPDHFRKVFNFKGGEFGNWVPQDERQRILNMAYDGLMDLSDILGVPPEALSLGGNLSIAFGSRGHGLTGAQAHYEPDRAVFNLTRIKGAGSVAHEWFHAFDHYFGFQDRGKKLIKNEKGIIELDKNKEREYISYGSVRAGKVRQEVAEAFKDVINTIYKQPKIIEVSIERFTKSIERNTQYLEQGIKQLRDYISQERSYGKKKAAATKEQLAKYDKLTDRIKKADLGDDAVIKTNQTKFGGMFSEIKTKQVFKDLNDLLRDITGRGHYKYDGGNVKNLDDYAKKISYDQSQYDHYVLNNKEQRDTPTKFYYDAKDLDKMRVSDYWSMKHEMAARAFEAYIEDRIKQTGNLSQYLVHSTENSVYKVMYDLSPYPEGVERERINESFDRLFKKISYRSSYDEKFGTLYSYMKDASVFDIKDLAEKSGQPAKNVSEALNDLAKRKLVNRVPGGFEPTDEFKILLDDLNEHPEKYGNDFNTLYSNPLPAIIKGVSRTITAVDDIYKRFVGDKVYKALGSIADKITPEKVKQLILTNYGLPTEYIAARREAYDALQRYKELAKEIGDNLLVKNPVTGEKFTDAEQKRLSQVIKGSVTMNPLIGARAMQAIREIKELEKLGKELEVLPLETYNSKLPRKRIQELLVEKEKLNKQRNKIIRGLKFEKDLVLSPELADELNATQKRALKRATKNVDQKIEDIHKKIVNSYVHGGEGYLKRVYLSKESAKRLAKYGYYKPTRLDLTSAMHRKDIPYEIRKEMGEILTAAYPAAKGIMLEGKDVSFGRFFEVISENPDWASETEVQGWTKMPKDPRLGKLSEMYVEPRIAGDINDVMKFTSDEELDKFLKRINATWKATKTIMNPATHLRNIYSNTIMLDFSGVPHTDQIRLLPEAIRAIRGEGRFAQQFKASRLNNTTFTTQELGEYLDIAAEDRGFLDMSLPDKLVKIYGKASLVDTKLGQFMGRVYQMEEVLGKAVKFISEIEKGKSIIEARQEANKWMFDYSEIPSLVRRLRTNPIFGMPFLTWSYKAFPRIIETAITRPITFWKYPVIFSALLKYSLKALGIDDDEWEKIKADLPERMIKGEWLLLPFRDSKGKLQMLDLTYILPYKDVYDVVESGFSLATSGRLNNADDIVDGILGLVQAPILKTTAELLTNRQTYTNQQIWFDIDNPGEKLQKAFDHMYKTFMPSLAPEIPFLSQGGYAYHKIRSVLSDRDDYYGRTFSFGPAITSVMLGLKTSPIEPEKNIERKEAKLQNELIQLSTKENQILRDGSLSEEQRLAKAMELERDKDEIRKQLAGMEIPIKNEEIASTEKAIRSLQAKYSKVDLNNTKLREQYATEINKLKIKLNELLSNPDAYTGEIKKKEPEKRGKQFNKSKTLQFQKEL